MNLHNLTTANSHWQKLTMTTSI